MELLSKSAAKDNPYFPIGKLLAAHSLRGAFKMRYLGDLPEQLLAIKSVYLQQTPEAPVEGPFAVEHLQVHKGQTYLLKLKGIDNRSAAESYAKQFVSIARAEAPDLPEETYYVDDLIGFTCVDADGETIGSVKHIVQGHQDLLVVATPDGKEHWVPFVFEMVPELDVDRREMVLTPPPGLFDL